MITFNCTIQQNIIPDHQRQTLTARLTQIAAQTLNTPPDDITVNYEIIPTGFAFRGGLPSTTSNIRSSIPPGTPQTTRVEFMQRIQDMWMEVTGQTTAELVVGAADSDYNPHQ